MAQVDFYVLPENGKREHFVCALIQKVWKQGNNIFINTGSESAATALDDLLWIYKDISFLPHCFVTEDSTDTTPIVIGHANQIDGQIPDHTPVMVNLAGQIPAELNKVERILEIVAGNEEERQQARQRYADYRSQGHVLNKHTIESSYG
jgi:DNA polymerase-3 subunit chi